jgi:uncharacterized membrane protein YgcG
MLNFFKHKKTGAVINAEDIVTNKVPMHHNPEFEYHPGPATHTFYRKSADDEDSTPGEDRNSPFLTAFALEELASATVDIARDTLGSFDTGSSDFGGFGGGDFGGGGAGGDF